MNKMDTLLEGLQHQQAHIEDEQAFADMVMERIEGVEDYTPRNYRGTPLRTYPGLTANIHWMFAPHLKRGRGRLTQQYDFQFAVRVAASVALVVLVGVFATLHIQHADSSEWVAYNSGKIDKYRIDRSQIPTDGTSREIYKCYQVAKREQTFYHNELIKYSHENM